MIVIRFFVPLEMTTLDSFRSGPYSHPVFFQEIVQGGAADLEEFGCLADVVAAQGQGPADSIFLGRLTGIFQGG